MSASPLEHEAQREMLRELAKVDYTPEEVHHFMILAECLTPDGGVDLDRMPEETKLFLSPIFADYLERHDDR